MHAIQQLLMSMFMLSQITTAAAKTTTTTATITQQQQQQNFFLEGTQNCFLLPSNSNDRFVTTSFVPPHSFKYSHNLNCCLSITDNG